MTEPRTLRRRAAALALIPAAAGVFGASVAWSGANDPAAPAGTTQAVAAPDPALSADPLGDLTAQVAFAEARISALQTVLAARAAQAEAARVQAEAVAVAADAARAQSEAEAAAVAAAAPAPAAAKKAAPAAKAPAAKSAPAPKVAAVTGASK